LKCSFGHSQYFVIQRNYLRALGYGQRITQMLAKFQELNQVAREQLGPPGATEEPEPKGVLYLPPEELRQIMMVMLKIRSKAASDGICPSCGMQRLSN
jgi:hypothetical protein